MRMFDPAPLQRLRLKTVLAKSALLIGLIGSELMNCGFPQPFQRDLPSL